MANYTLENTKISYTIKWSKMVITRQPAITAAANKVIAGKARYQIIEATTGVPWYFIGILHLRESDCNFHTHLHNGDSLARRTVHVPAGRPKTGTPPFSFEFSAQDALAYEGFTKIKDWSLEQMAYSFEQYNGWGYRNKGYSSAYLWSGTNQYTRGKFVSDGVFDPSVVDVQVGTMGVLKTIAQLQNITFVVSTSPTSVPTVPLSHSAEIPRPTTVEMNTISRKHWWNSWLQALGWTGGGSLAALKSVDATQIQATKGFFDSIKQFGAEYGIYFAGAALFGIAIYSIYQSKLMKDDVQEGRFTPSGEEPVVNPNVVVDENIPATESTLI